MKRLLLATLALLALAAPPARAAIQVANYPDPQGGPADTIAQAYLYVVQMNLSTGFTHKAPDGSDTIGDGLVTAYIYRSAAAANNQGAGNVGQVTMRLGELLVPATGSSSAVYAPTLEQLAASAAQIQATTTPTPDPFSAFRLALYRALKQHPQISKYTLTDVP